MNINYKMRAVQLDLARQMETIPFLKNFIDFIAENHYNTLFLYLEWRVRTKTFDIGKNDGYSAEELKEIIDYAELRGIDVIPGLAALGHAELILEQKKFSGYAELREGVRGRFKGKMLLDFCPSLPETRKFLESYFMEVGKIFQSDYIHVGGDEAWDVGFCSKCREKAASFDGEQSLYLEHFKFCHQIVSKKLGKRMMMWDDMLEYYTDILPEFPKDVIMVNWQYQENVTGWLGHFANLTFFDQLAVYEKLGFDYLVAPADFRWGNVESSSNSARNKKPLGGLLTSWEKKTALMYKFFPLMAGAGWLWSGSAADGDDAMTLACKQLFGVDDELFLLAVKQYSAGLDRAASLSMNDLTGHPFFGPNNAAFLAARTMTATLMNWSGKLKDSRAEVILGDIIDDCIMKLLGMRSQIAAYKMLKGQESEPLEEIIQELDAVAASRIAACELHRRKCDAVHFKANFDRWRKALQDFSSSVKKQGKVRVLFCLPDGYGAERIRITAKCAGKTIEIADGVFKCGNHALFESYFFLPKNAEPDSIRIEASGFSGQGICYVSAHTSKGEFVPAGVIGASGIAEHPEHVLTPNVNFCYLGSQNALDSFHDRAKSNLLNTLEIAMKKV